MRDGVVDIDIGHEVLLLGQLSARYGVPRALREPRRAQMVLPRLAAMPSAMRRLRSYWADQWSTQAVANLSDHDVLRVVGGAIETGQLQAAVVPRIIPSELARTATPANRARTVSAARAARAVPPTRTMDISPTSAAPVPSSPPRAVAPGQTLPIAQWPLEQRVAEVIRRTIPKVPGDIGATLLSLLSPESLAFVAGTMVFSAAANLTPYGWAADAVIVGIAVGFGGLAALHALGDLVECFKRTVGATSEQDLDAAADALARAVVGLGVVALMVVLHRVAGRKGGGGPPSGAGNAGQAGEQAMQREMAAARAERLKARLQAHQEKAKLQQEGATVKRSTEAPAQGMPQTGAGNFSGSADEAYEAIRASTTDVASIAKNTGYKTENIQKVKDHLFYDEHLLDRYVDYGVPAKMGRFDSDTSIAEAWARLENGTQTPADIQLLKHETAEAWYMRRHGPSYNAAHNAAQARFPAPGE